MAAGNTFGATALSSYGGFWIAMGITFTPGGFNIMGALEKSGGGSPAMFYDSLGLFLMVYFPLSRPLPLPHTLPVQSPANKTGMVHFHLPPDPVHAQIHICVLWDLHRRRYRLSTPRHRLHPPQRHC